MSVQKVGFIDKSVKRRFLPWVVCLFIIIGCCFAVNAAGHGSDYLSLPSAHKNNIDMYKIDNVPFISQLVNYPTGCESVSAVMVLNYLGVDISADEFIDKYLPTGEAPYTDDDGAERGCDPWKFFPGDPRTDDGWGCFAPVISNAVNSIGADVKAIELYDKTIERLCTEYIENDIPVIFWATLNMETPYVYSTWIADDGKEITWTCPMHCLVLIGFDEDYYYFNDPTAGADVFYDKNSVETAYEGQGCQAVVVKSIKK